MTLAARSGLAILLVVVAAIGTLAACRGNSVLEVASTTAPSPESAPAYTPASDRVALVALYQATGGANWRNSDNWLSEAPLDEWYGVTTDRSGRVIELALFENGLSGEIPAELGSLSNLRELYLFRNQLTGGMPPELGSLSNLQGLYLSDNQLGGEIPPELGNLSSLRLLAIDNGNRLSGEIPPELGRLSNLVTLYLSGNQLSGNVPSELGNLSDLRVLYLSGNQLSGEIPLELGNLSDLVALHLSDNQLSGCVPKKLRGTPYNDFDQLGLPLC